MLARMRARVTHGPAAKTTKGNLRRFVQCRRGCGLCVVRHRLFLSLRRIVDTSLYSLFDCLTGLLCLPGTFFSRVYSSGPLRSMCGQFQRSVLLLTAVMLNRKGICSPRAYSMYRGFAPPGEFLQALDNGQRTRSIEKHANNVEALST